MRKIILIFFCFVQYAWPFTYFRSVETLQTIQNIIINKKKGAYLRFGDGDFALAHGIRSGTHTFSTALQNEMIEAFGMNDPYIIKTLLLVCQHHGGHEVKMFHGKYLPETDCIAVREKAEKIWGKKIDHIYSPVALPYTAVHMPDICIAFLKFIKHQKCVFFVGNESTPTEIIHRLFGNCEVVGTPRTTAYDKIDRIEKECLIKLPHQSNEYRVAIISCGNTGRVLIKRLWAQIENIFFFDMGSLMDALCGWKSRGWIRTTHFNEAVILSHFPTKKQLTQFIYTKRIISIISNRKIFSILRNAKAMGKT